MEREAARIERFLAPFPRGGRDVVAGPGDDCALTRVGVGKMLVSKVDQVVEGVHFGPAFRPEEIGHKALAVALSDLAAAGAAPSWILVAVALPPRFSPARLDGIARGMAKLARHHEVALVGGNFSRASELSIAVTALGQARRPLRRAGARAGDLLYVSGALGSAAHGLARLKDGRPRRLSSSERAQLTPTPRLALGALGARHARASIDVSDGLLLDLGHLLQRSRLGARIELARIPRTAALLALGTQGLRYALTGGEDYELLLAIPRSRARTFERAAASLGERVTSIGELTSRRSLVLLDARGRQVAPPARGGFDHFQG